MPKLKKRVLSYVEVNITMGEAKDLVAEARINDPGELDVYERCRSNPRYIQRIFTLIVPLHMDNDDDLLGYARDHIPEGIVFGG